MNYQEMIKKFAEFEAQDMKIKEDQKKLNDDISAFYSQALGLEGTFTLVSLSKKLLEKTYEPKIIT